MEFAVIVEENQPPQKKLKQATLSFFKGKNDISSKTSNLQGRKRHSSSSSESPSKLAKVSKPLAVLTAESPNSKSVQDNIKSNNHESSDQEVSSSSEADCSVKKTNGKSFMDRFVKKKVHDCSEEISSTNNDLGSLVEVSDIDKENNGSINKSSETATQALQQNHSDSDCFIITCKEEASDKKIKDKIDDVSSDTLLTAKEEKKANEEDNGLKQNASERDMGGKKETGDEIIDNATELHDNKKENDEIVEDDEDIEMFDTSLNAKLDDGVTSTPLKANTGSDSAAELDLTPKNTSVIKINSSGKKPGRKIDLAKKAERELLKQKQKEEKEELRLAKKKKLDEEKAEKDRVKKELKEIKEKVKQELKEKLEKEKLEKEKAKEEEKKMKEEQRLKKQAELEAKQEEKKKKDEERKQKEQEKLKEEEEKRKKEEKEKKVFQSFFKAKDYTQKINQNKSSPGIFVPFELKKDMHLAPTLRRDALSEQKKNDLDHVLKDCEPSDSNYLQQLRSQEIRPKSMGRILRKNPEPSDEMDLDIIHDSEALKTVFHKVKILLFHTDNRPPYRGTWKKVTNLNPRNPFKKDEDVFDYEVDSDEEWEEEEPGESLSCSDGEGEEEKDDNEEDEEDGWMVPHGYLSEDEGCNEDEEISPEKLKLQQLAKAKAWEEEQKRKVQALPIVVVGCFFEHSPSIGMSGDVRLLYQYKGTVLGKETPIPTALSNALAVPKCEDVIMEDGQSTPLQKGPKKRSVPDEAMPDLIQLVHGNICGIKKLIKEFRIFWLRKTNSCLDSSYEEDLNESTAEQKNDLSLCDDSTKDISNSDVHNKSVDANCSQSKPLEEGHGCEISKRQLEKKIMAMAVREKRQCMKKTAWFVHDSVLAEYKMADIQLPNTWVFLSSRPSVSPTPKLSTQVSTEGENVKKDEAITVKPVLKDQRSIMDFTKTKEELEELRKSQGDSLTKQNDCVVPSVNNSEISLPVTPKEKKASGQRSIIDFTKSVKTSEKNVPIKADVTLAEVIVIEDEANV